jgi:ABC-type transport system involved in cytochrome c biogenesis permease subunit
MIAIIAIIFSYVLSLQFRFMVYAGLTAHAGYILYRGMTAGRLPIVGTYDTLLFMSLSIVIFALSLKPFLKKENNFTAASNAVAALFLIPLLVMKPNDNPLPPVLDTYWFEIHVVLSFFGYALFVTGAILGIIYITKRDLVLERLQYRSILIGYTFFSIAMISGGIWAFYAWGTYWLWTPKEFWTSILWLYYSFYLHTRLQNKLTGKTASLVGTFGALVMIFTYLGVGLLMKSSHSF